MLRKRAAATGGSRFGIILGLALAVAATFGVPKAWAGFIDSVPNAANYVILFEGKSGSTLNITNDKIQGNIGIGNSGHVTFSGPGAINGSVNFSAANSGQYSNTNGATGAPSAVNYNVSAVTTALTQIATLSSSLGAETGTNIAISGTQTINASTGKLDAKGNYVFTVTSFSQTSGQVLTIQNAGGHSVVFNFAAGNVTLGGDVVLNGLSDDQVLWNFTGTGNTITLSNNASGNPGKSFQGDILAVNDTIAATNANLSGRIWGGDSTSMQLTNGDTIRIPEPSSLALLVSALGGYVALRRRRRS